MNWFATSGAPFSVAIICKLPYRLKVNDSAVIAPGLELTVYREPKRNSARIVDLPGGYIVKVVSGPRCDPESNMMFWQVEYGTPQTTFPGQPLHGWVAEGVNNVYWLIPYTPRALWPDTIKRLSELDLGRTVQAWHPNGVTGLAYAPLGSIVASADADGNVQLWNVSMSMALGSAKHPGGVSILVFDDRDILATGGKDGVHLWNYQADPVQEFAFLPSASPVISIAFDPGSLFVAVVEQDGTVSVWDTLTLRRRSSSSPSKTSGPDYANSLFMLPPTRLLEFPTTGVASVTFSPDRSILLGRSADGKIVKLWGLKGQPPN
jgi:WD40 repeat protein